MKDLDIKYIFKAVVGEQYEGGFDKDLLKLYYSADGETPTEEFMSGLAKRWLFNINVSPESDVVYLELTIDATVYPLMDDYIVVYEDGRVGMVSGCNSDRLIRWVAVAAGLNEQFDGTWEHPAITLEENLSGLLNNSNRKFVDSDDKILFVLECGRRGALLNKRAFEMTPIVGSDNTEKDVIVHFNTRHIPCVLKIGRGDGKFLLALDYHDLLEDYKFIIVVFESGRQVVLIKNKWTKERNAKFIAKHSK